MKKLIIYDASCPMCRLYTKGMVLADTSGNLTRLGSNQLTDKCLLNRLDRQRARHEIPMIDLDGEDTLYGVDTWAYSLGRRSKPITNLLSLHWFRSILQKLYAFISYNRRIIITSAPGRWQLMDLQPDFHFGYRLVFVLLVMTMSGGLLYSSIDSSGWTMLASLSVQLGLASLYIWKTNRAEFLQMLLDYCGHLGMSLFLGGVIIAISLHFHCQSARLIGSALAISQHFIRAYRLGLNPWLSACFAASYLLILPL